MPYHSKHLSSSPGPPLWALSGVPRVGGTARGASPSLGRTALQGSACPRGSCISGSPAGRAGCESTCQNTALAARQHCQGDVQPQRLQLHTVLPAEEAARQGHTNTAELRGLLPLLSSTGGSSLHPCSSTPLLHHPLLHPARHLSRADEFLVHSFVFPRASLTSFPSQPLSACVTSELVLAP